MTINPLKYANRKGQRVSVIAGSLSLVIFSKSFLSQKHCLNDKQIKCRLTCRVYHSTHNRKQ